MIIFEKIRGATYTIEWWVENEVFVEIYDVLPRLLQVTSKQTSVEAAIKYVDEYVTILYASMKRMIFREKS